MKYLYEARLRGTKVAVVNTYFEPGLRELLGALGARSRRSSAPASPTTGSPSTPAATSPSCAACSRPWWRRGGSTQASSRGAPRASRRRRRRSAAARLGAAGEGQRRRRARRWRASPRCWRDAQRDLRVVDGAHPARARRRDDPGPRQRRPGPGLARAREGRPHADPRALRRAGWRRGGLRARPGGAAAHALRRGVGLPLPGLQGLTAAEMVDAAYRRRPRRVLDRRRELPGDAARSRGGGGGPGQGGHPHPPGHRALVDDAAAARGHGRALPGHHALRVAGRGHRDLDRAAHHLLARGARAAAIGSAKPEWEVFGEVAARVRPDRAAQVRFRSSQEIRDEIARAVPLYAGIERLGAPGRPVPVGRAAPLRGRPLPHRPTARRASRVVEPVAASGAGRGRSTSPRAAASSSTRWCSATAIPSPAPRRDDVLISAEDAARLGIARGDRVRLRSRAGSYVGTRPHRGHEARQPGGALAGGQRAPLPRGDRPPLARARLQRCRRGSNRSEPRSNQERKRRGSMPCFRTA